MKITLFIFSAAVLINVCRSNGNSGHLSDGRTERYRRNVISNFLTRKFINYVEDKLIEHSSALQLILESVNKMEGVLKKLEEKINLGGLKSKLLGNSQSDRRRSIRRYQETVATTDPVPYKVQVVNRNRRAISSVYNKFVEFVEEKLIQHSTALEFIAKSAHASESLLKKLLEKLDTESVESKSGSHEGSLLNNINTRRFNQDMKTNQNTPTEKDNSVVGVFKPLITYGNIARRLIENEFRSEEDPLPIEETYDDQEENYTHDKSVISTGPIRRMGDAPALQQNYGQDLQPLSPWCRAGAFCEHDKIKACGHDEKYGFHQFEDICHMMKFNCQTKFNYILSACEPPANNNGIVVGS